MYAVIASGGKQYKVSVGDEIFVEKLPGESGDEVVFEDVLALMDEDKLKIGSELEGVKVKGEILKQGRAKKIIVFKYKAKKNYRKKNGHRQPYTRVSIKSIG